MLALIQNLVHPIRDAGCVIRVLIERKTRYEKRLSHILYRTLYCSESRGETLISSRMSLF